MAGACPFHNQILRADDMSSSDRGNDTDGANSTSPRWLTETFCGDWAASAGTLTVCFAAKFEGSYSFISPVEVSTQSRLPCPDRGAVKHRKQHSTHEVILMRLPFFRTRTNLMFTSPLKVIGYAFLT